MSKTWLSVVTALALIALSVALIVARARVLGREIDGTPGIATWRVTLQVEGELVRPEATLTTILPPDFRRQHVSQETFLSAELGHRMRKSRGPGPRRAIWQRRPGPAGPQPFQLTYTFQCVLGMRRAAPGMGYRTRVLDAAPPEGQDVKPAPRMEAEHEEIASKARDVAASASTAEERVHALYQYVAGLEVLETDGTSGSALDCLRRGGGDAGARGRLLVALCRNQGMAARLMTGLVLEADGPQRLHHWAEAWIGDRWLPMCPVYRHFGVRRFPDEYLILLVGDDRLVREPGVRSQIRFTAQNLHHASSPDTVAAPTFAHAAWRRLTLGNLRPDEQEWVKFLLLLPIAALVVSVFRTLIGLTTFGTFGPALLGLVCRDLRDLPWVLLVFVGIILIGWGLRRLLDYFHLLLVPRVSILLTLIVLLLVGIILFASPYGLIADSYIALLPLVILTHMVERFWTLEAEDGTGASLRTLGNTLLVAVAVSFVVHLDVLVNGLAQLVGRHAILPGDMVRMTLFRYPEGLGLAVAAQLLVGRYTGYRLTELFRFRDLLMEESSPGGNDEPAGPLPAAAATGRAGDEQPQHRMHPRSEPAAVFSPGGRQAADARPVSGDRRADT